MKNQSYLISTQSYRHEYDSNVEIPTQYGYLVETDFNDSLRYLSIPTPTHSPYGERIKPGLRGLSFWRKRVYVASWNTIYIVDYNSFKVIHSFSHPLMADLHGIHVDDQGIWVTSSLIDSLLHFDWSYHLRGVLAVPGTTVYPPQERFLVDLTQDYRLRGKLQRGFQYFHANHVTAYNQNYVLVTGRGKGRNKGRILLVNRRTLRYKLWFTRLFGPHDGLLVDNQYFAVTETNSSSVALIKISGWLGPYLYKRLYLPPHEAKFWTRGLGVAPDNSLLIGQSVWAGDNRLANVVHMAQDGSLLATYELELEDYPECRIFQIVPVQVSNQGT